jgi:hypothetical protein
MGFTGIRLADVGSSECDMICLDVSKTAACKMFAALSDVKCNDMLLRSVAFRSTRLDGACSSGYQAAERWTKEEIRRS